MHERYILFGVKHRTTIISVVPVILITLRVETTQRDKILP